MKDIRCIIVEGPDNCGKDTLCEYVKAAVQNYRQVYPVYLCPKFSKLVNDWMGEMKSLKKFVEDFVREDNREQILILNRSWFDEAVYGPIYRNYSPEDLEWLYDISDDVSSHILYVSMDAPTEVLVSREDGLSFSEGSEDKINEEREAFVKIFQRICTILPHTMYLNTSKVPKDEMWKQIGKYLGYVK